ncbi:MAG: xanthine dehydrogenase family protein molybdopterin-binding subunit [Spirochaetaceae bacterium]|jgi:CO/xanthine dehydrogenase Mo-binding subunit|nr:xanthine dehydrogenase family protein molybdopterin-binding subunit [Spirochaetaceae bacterium]
MLLDDICVEGMRYAVLLRAQTANGRIKALHFPSGGEGVRVICGAEIPGENRLLGTDMPLLAVERAVYAGEPLALIVASSAREAAACAAACVVEFEEEPAGFSMETFTTENVFEKFHAVQGEPAVCAAEHGGAADCGEQPLFKAGNTYQTGMQYHWASEPAGALAEPAAGGGVALTLACVSAAYAQEAAALALGVAAETVRVTPLPAGIHFDAKHRYPAALAAYAALAARLTGTPVRLSFTRDEEYAYAPKRSRARFGLQSFADKDGLIQKTLIDARFDYGAWNLWGARDACARDAGAHEQTPLAGAFGALLNVYNLGEVHADGIAVCTNLPPAGPFCGSGVSQGLFALENHINNLTDTLQLCALEWRKDNLSRDPLVLPAENRALLETLLDTAEAQSGYKRKRAAYKALLRQPYTEADRVIARRGIGLALAALPPAAGCDMPPLAAVAVLETEIDKVDYHPVMRNVWLVIAVPKPEDKHQNWRPAHRSAANPQRAKMRRAVTQGFLAALGWALCEKVEYVNGAVVPPLSSGYQMLKPSETPKIQIEFVETSVYTAHWEGALSGGGGHGAAAQAAAMEPFLRMLRQTPFHVIPSAYLQAVSQAARHEFVKIPLSPVNIWNFLRTQEAGENRHVSTARAGGGGA